jgi:predicted XRE-type DNA-binding protein
MEIWKDVSGYEGIYQISSYGRIKSMARKVRARNGAMKPLIEKIMTPLFTSQGYLNIVASRNQVRGTLVIHHLVASHFIGDRPHGLVIDHIDGNITNNRVDNLRYVTTKANLRKRKDVKLNYDCVEKIRNMIGNFSQKEIAGRFNVSQSLISKIATGKLWAADGV